MSGRTIGRSVPCLVVVSLALLASACTSLPRGSEDAARRSYDAGLAAYNSGDLDGAVSYLEEASMRAHSGELRADIEYSLGKVLLDRGDRRSAAEHFALSHDTTDQRIKRFRASKWKGQACYLDRDFAQAAAAFRACLALESDDAFLDEIYYKLAVSMRELGSAGEAETFYAKVRHYSPGPLEPSWGARPSSRRQLTVAPAATGAAFLASIGTRTDWGASPTRSNHDRMTTIRRVTIHHSAQLSDATTERAVAREIRAIQKSHQQGRNWADIGYHYIIDRGGRVWEGRPIDVQGAHAGNPQLNRGNVGIVLLGNFNLQVVNSDQKHSLRTLLYYLMGRYGVTESGIETHRELKSTECPGADLQRVVDRMRAELRSDPPSTRALAHQREIKHYVQRGETLYSISKRYGIKVSDLKQANSSLRGNYVLAGQELRIPLR